MTDMIVPSIHSYFAIYTVESDDVSKRRGANWDLHATATDRMMAISHARMLALQPGVSEVHVKQVTENPFNGIVSVRDVIRCGRGTFAGSDAFRQAGYILAAIGFVLFAALVF